MTSRQSRRPARRRRTAPPEERREQLIAATIRCVANQGLADTTIATVAREAGLSQGIINLHFQTKEGLLTETLRFLADEYRNACRGAAEAAEVSPAAGLEAMVELDFRRTICARDKLAVWFAFWGERKFRPTYRRICAEREAMDGLLELGIGLREAAGHRGGPPAGRESFSGAKGPTKGPLPSMFSE